MITHPVASAPDPSAAMASPAMAGPTMRARLNEALLRPTALVSSCGSTISLTKDCRAGASKAVPTPKTKASTYTCQGSATPVTASTPSRSAGAAIITWVTWSRRRLGNRSATSPAYGESSSIGRNWRPVVMPRAVPLLAVSWRTSQSWATRCIQVPVFDTTPPAAYSR